MEKENCLDGYIFLDENLFIRAQKEKQMIDKLKESLKPDDMEAMYQVYNRLVDKPCFITPVGLGFLHEMREYLADTMGDGNVQPVPVPRQYVKKQTSDILMRKEEKLRNENNALKAVKSKLVIAVVALCVIVIGMIFIVVSNENLGYFNAEEKVLDKYSAWQERLETWEEQLNEREEMLENSQN